MEKECEYRVEWALTIADLESKVTGMMSLGFQLAGGMVTTINGPETHMVRKCNWWNFGNKINKVYFFQSMFKIE